MIVAMPSLVSVCDHQHIVLDNVSWSTYQKLLHDLNQRPIRLTYDNGSLEIMPPLPIHEWWKGRLGRMIELVSLERKIEVEALGSTTFSRHDLAKGLEPDECYYIQHAANIRDKLEIDLSIDPPPDLAVEVDITRRSIRRQPIYQALRVPELWRFDGVTLHVLRLGRGKIYKPAASSGVVPFLAMKEFERFLLRLGSGKQLPVLEEFQRWVRSL